ARQFGMLLQIEPDIEERMRIFSLLPAFPAVMKKSILVAVPACAKQRVRIAALRCTQLQIMQQWVPSGLRDIRVLPQVKRAIQKTRPVEDTDFPAALQVS